MAATINLLASAGLRPLSNFPFLSAQTNKTC